MKHFTKFNEQVNSDANAFCMLKPEFTDHELDFAKELSNNGWNILRKKKQAMSFKQAKDLYSPHKDKDFYFKLCKYMSSGNSIGYDCYKDCENPIKDMKDLKHQIRDKWGKDEMKNGMHSSDSMENVNRESKIYFDEGHVYEDASNEVVYRSDAKYEELLSKIKNLPDEKQKPIIKKYLELKKKGQVDVDTLISEFVK